DSRWLPPSSTLFPYTTLFRSRKVVWLMHQHRAAYELSGTPFSDFTSSDDDRRLQQEIADLDTRMFAECGRIVTNAQNTADRLKQIGRAHVRTPVTVRSRMPSS